MPGAIFALIIALMMIGFVIYKGNATEETVIFCKKSELFSVIGDFPDNCVFHIRIGRNTKDARRNRKAGRRNLRNNISE